MKRRRITIVLTLLILIPAAGIVYMLGTPHLANVSPTIDDQDVPASASLQLTFSRSMQEATVTGRLSIEPAQPGSFSWEGNTLIFKPDSPWPSGQKVSVRLAAGARAAGLLALPMPEASSWSFTVRQPRLAYLYPADAAANIYVLNPLSGTSRPLTNNPGGVMDFDVSASGTTIYYSVRGSQGGSNIYRLDNLDSSQGKSAESELPKPVSVVKCPQALCRFPHISPQGDYLAYERTALLGSNQPTFPQVWLLPLKGDGSSEAQPEPFQAGEADHQTLQPAWSPTGLLTFYDTNLSAFVILDPHTGQKKLFPNQTGQPGVWDPSGQDYVAPEVSYVYAGDTDQTGLNPVANSHLILFNLKDGTTQDLSVDENLEDAAPAFSPDGKYLAFARKYLDVPHWTPGRQLWIMNTDGSGAHPLTNEPFYNHYDFAWSSSDDQLAYVRFNQTVLTEPPEIWLIDPTSGRATSLVKGGYAPQWIP